MPRDNIVAEASCGDAPFFAAELAGESDGEDPSPTISVTCEAGEVPCRCLKSS